MSVNELNPLTDDRWSEFLNRSDGSSVFHTRKWLAALSAAYGYDAVAFTTTQPGRPLENAIVFCRVKSALTGTRLVSLPFSDHCEPLMDEDELREVLGQFPNGAVPRTWKYVELRPVNPLQPELVERAGLGLSSAFYLHTLDLRPGAKELFPRFHKNCVQRKIHRAEREKLTLRKGRCEDLLKIFYRLLMLTRRRHKIPPQPLSWFRSLIHCFEDDLTIWVAFKGEQPIASILTLSHNRTLTYKYGCSDSEHHNLGGMPFLFWHAIQEGTGSGFEWFDFGRSEVENWGLVEFKDHWATTRHELNYYRHPGPRQNQRPAWRAEAARRTFSLLPDFCLTAAGRLLYRHIG